MALDHTAYYNSVNILAEHYEGLTSHLPETIYRLLGLITNLSAPTFWLVSGISIALLSGGTRGSKGLEWKVTRYLWVRSLALLVLDATVVPLLWNKHFIPHYQYHFDLLSSFAVSMLLLSVLRFLPWPLMLSICLGILGSFEWVAQHMSAAAIEHGGVFVRLWATFAAEDKVPPGMEVPFPVLGWFGLMGCGYVLGTRLSPERMRRASTWITLGLALLAAWFVIRVMNGYGNMHPRSFRDDPWELFIMYKGPVSLAYLAWNLGWASFVFAAIASRASWLKKQPWRWGVAFGQASLFVYLAHMLVYRFAARFELKFIPGHPVFRYITTCLFGLIVLVPMARWYARWKHAHPEPILKYL